MSKTGSGRSEAQAQVRAADALASLIGHPALPEPPRVGEGISPVAAVEVRVAIEEPFKGEIRIALSADGARVILRNLGESSDLFQLDEGGLSALREIGNVLGSAYLTAISSLSGTPIVPSVPWLEMGGKIRDPEGEVWVATRLHTSETEGAEIILQVSQSEVRQILKAATGE